MENRFKVFVDIHNTDKMGRLRLNTKGAIIDIEQQSIKLEQGCDVLLYDDEGIEIQGTLEFSDFENIWTAKIDWIKLLGRPRS